MYRPDHRELSHDIHQSNVEAGWWTNIETGQALERNFGEMLALVHSEVSECWEGYATKVYDQHLPEFDNWHVEVADACIRVYDMLGGCFASHPVFVPFALDLPEGFVTFEDRIVFLHTLLSRVLENWRKSRKTEAYMYLYRFLDACFEIANDYRFDLMAVIYAKWAFNRTRADHKIENRLLEDGKKI